MAKAKAPPGNPQFMARVATLFGQEEDSDCRVVFVLECACGNDGKKRKAIVGEALPAHAFVLRYACDKFAAQLSWRGRAAAGADAADAGGSADEPAAKRQRTAAPSDPLQQQLPEVEVTVRSEEEVPAALAVVKFAYTGLVEPVRIREALQVLRQAAYLQMGGCVEACLTAIKGMLLAGTGGGAGSPAAGGGNSSSSGGVSGGGGTDGATPGPPVLELYSCTQLWPDPEQEPAFAALLTEAKRPLVAHFGDALAVLNREELFDHLLDLPAVGLEALLESDDFGTDSESSVVLVLAEWMAANYGSTDAATWRRLCGLLRLARCSPAYLDWVLPALALDHHDHPDNEVGWFPITPHQAAWLSKYAGAAGAMKKALWESRGLCGGIPEGWLNDKPRLQCVPAAGLTFTYSLGKEEILEKFAGMGEKDFESLCPGVDASRGGSIWAMGLEWYPEIEYTQGESEAAAYLSVRVPYTYKVEIEESGMKSTVCDLNDLERPMQMLRADLFTRKWEAGGQREDALVGAFGSHQIPVTCLNRGRGGQLALSGAPAPPAPPPQQEQEQAGEEQQQAQVHRAQEQAGEEQQQRAREAAVAAQWADYLREGKLSGKIVVRPPRDT